MIITAAAIVISIKAGTLKEGGTSIGGSMVSGATGTAAEARGKGARVGTEVCWTVKMFLCKGVKRGRGY